MCVVPRPWQILARFEDRLARIRAGGKVSPGWLSSGAWNRAVVGLRRAIREERQRIVSEGSGGKLGLLAVIAIGVGGMVGGGIFAVLGLAVQLAQGGTPVAFALAGVVALLTAYSYARLSVRYPSRGGTVTFTP